MCNSKYFCRSALGALLLMITIFFVACENKETVLHTQPSQEDVTKVVGAEPSDTIHLQQNLVVMQTKYLDLSYPEIYADVLLHQEVISDMTTMELFSLKTHGGTMELFRIYFGDETVGSVAGYLSLDGTEIPVTYTICQFNDDEFPDEEVRALYYDTMNCFNDLMDSLQADDRFHTQKVQTPVENTEIVLSYWSFILPKTMECEEYDSNRQYKVTFFGNVSGDRVALYTICLGEPSVETVLGTYFINGEAKILSLESYDIIPTGEWTDESQEAAYDMMATVNDVLRVIMSDENFSDAVS